MNRREALIRIGPIPLLAASLSACTEHSESKGKIIMTPYNEQELHGRLEAMRLALDRKFPGTSGRLQPGLSEDEIRRQTAWFPGELSAEVIGLYKWRNGYLDQSQSKDPPFWFRDYVFTPIENAEEDYRSMMSTYGAQADVHEMLKTSFPFASLGGGWLVLPAAGRVLTEKIPRAVVSVYQGVTVFFHSVNAMAQTCAAWVEHPKNDGFGLRPADEMEIWQRFNPGIFQR
jgi:hypothetical protein